MGPHRRPRTDLGRHPPPHPRAPRGRGRNWHRPVVGRRPRRRQVGSLRRRPLGRRPAHGGRPRCRPGSIEGPPAAGAVRRRRMPGRRPPPNPADHAARGRPRSGPCPPSQGHLPGRQVPQQARVRHPRRRVRPGLAGRAAAPSGDRLLRSHPHRAVPGRLCRHPCLSGGGHPAVPRYLPPPGSARRRRPRRGPRRSGRRWAAANRQDRRAVQGGLRVPAAPVILDPGQQYSPGPISCGVCGQDFQSQDTASNKAGRHAATPRHGQVG
jgi:hypothetical protein